MEPIKSSKGEKKINTFDLFVLHNKSYFAAVGCNRPFILLNQEPPNNSRLQVCSFLQLQSTNPLSDVAKIHMPSSVGTRRSARCDDTQ